MNLEAIAEVTDTDLQAALRLMNTYIASESLRPHLSQLLCELMAARTTPISS